MRRRSWSMKGANINAVDPDGISAAVLATINGHYDVAAFLIDKGANANLADKTGRTALYLRRGFPHTMPQVEPARLPRDRQQRLQLGD